MRDARDSAPERKHVPNPLLRRNGRYSKPFLKLAAVEDVILLLLVAHLGKFTHDGEASAGIVHIFRIPADKAEPVGIFFQLPGQGSADGAV
jgi:hypothetical protein